MGQQTLAQAAELGLDDLQSGLAQTIVTVAPGLGLIPFNTVSGNAYVFNREVSLVDGQAIAADGTITDSSVFETAQTTVAISGISGQSDINKMHLAMQIGSNAGNDLRAMHLASAAKGVSREYLRRLINGTVAGNGWDGLKATLAGVDFTSQIEDASAAAFSFDVVDAALARCMVQPQWLMGNAAMENAFRKAMRASGGVTTVELNGVYFLSYSGIPFIRNDYILTAGGRSDMYVGTWDDGSATGGLAGITTNGPMFQVDTLSALEGKNAERVRVVMYGAAAVFSPYQVAKLEAVAV